MTVNQRNSQDSVLVDDSPIPETEPTVDAPVVHGLRRPIYFLLALVFLVLGVLGVLLPGVPATPFLLLMSYFLIRVSPKLHARVMRWPVVGPPLKDWQDHQGVRLHVKLTAWTMVVLVVGATVCLTDMPPWAAATIMALAAIGMYVVYRLPTVRD